LAAYLEGVDAEPQDIDKGGKVLHRLLTQPLKQPLGVEAADDVEEAHEDGSALSVVERVLFRLFVRNGRVVANQLHNNNNKGEHR